MITCDLCEIWIKSEGVHLENVFYIIICQPSGGAYKLSWHQCQIVSRMCHLKSPLRPFFYLKQIFWGTCGFSVVNGRHNNYIEDKDT